MSKKVQLLTVKAPKLIVMDFHGDKVEGVRVKVAEETRDYFGLKRICENLGLVYRYQREKISQIQEIFGKDAVVQVKAPAPDGKAYYQTALERRAMYYLLANLSPSKVKPEVKEKLKLYIRELFDAWDKYIQSGQASQEVREFLGIATEGAKVSQELIEANKELTEAKKELIITVAQRLRVKTLREIKADLEGYKERHENVEEWVEDSLKQIHQQLAGKQVAIKVRITVKEFLESKGFRKLTSGELGMFGRFARAEFEKKYGRPPTKAVERIRGGTKEVTVYYYNAEKDYDVLKRALQRWVDWREKFLSKKRKSRKKSKGVSRGKKATA